MTNEKGGSALLTVSLKAVLKAFDGRILMLEKTGKNHWDLPGGKLDDDENMTRGLLREVFEETALKGLVIDKIIHAGRRSFDEPDKADRILIFYLCHTDQSFDTIQLSEEHCSWRLMSKDDLENSEAYEINPVVREALAQVWA